MDGAPDVPVGHLASCQRINAGEGVDIVHHAVALDRAGAVIGHGELLIVQRRRGVHAAVENGSVQSSRDHDTDADVSGVLASVDDVGHLVVRLTRIEHHVVALILSRVGFDLVIGVERIAGFVLAGIASAQLIDVGPQLHISRIDIIHRSAVGIAGILAVQAGLKQVDLHIADGEGVVRGLRIGEVREGAADDKRRDEHDRDGSHKNGFLLHM